MQSEEHDKYEEIEERDQSMEHHIRSNAGTDVNILEMSFNEKIYVHGQNRQLLTMKDKYDTSKEIDTYMSLAHDVMFTQMSEKKRIYFLDNDQLRLCSKSTKT